ncbi:hypothetical protein HK101_005654, partial [Irineochytrium annulatum]
RAVFDFYVTVNQIQDRAREDASRTHTNGNSAAVNFNGTGSAHGLNASMVLSAFHTATRSLRTKGQQMIDGPQRGSSSSSLASLPSADGEAAPVVNAIPGPEPAESVCMYCGVMDHLSVDCQRLQVDPASCLTSLDRYATTLSDARVMYLRTYADYFLKIKNQQQDGGMVE